MLQSPSRPMIDYEGAPSMPSELVLASLDGELHPLAAWRKSVGLDAGRTCGEGWRRAASVSDIESRKIDPRLSTLKALATGSEARHRGHRGLANLSTRRHCRAPSETYSTTLVEIKVVAGQCQSG